MKKWWLWIMSLALLGAAQAQGTRHGLEAYYNFLGNCDDLSVYGVHGTGINISYGQDRWASANSAVLCQPSDTNQRIYVQVPDTVIDEIHNQITLCAWVRYEDVARTRLYPTIVSKCYSETLPNDHSYFIGLDNGTKKWQMGFGTDSAMYILQSQDSATIGDWVHLVVLYNNGYVKNYVNGRIQDSVQTVGALHYSNIGLRMGIGRINVADNQWIGSIDEVLLYDRILSDVQIQALANIRPTAITYVQNNFTPIKIKVYPNPMSHFLNVESEQIWDNVVIMDGWGRVVARLEQPTQRLDLSFLDNGFYFLKWSNAQTSAVTRLEVRK